METFRLILAIFAVVILIVGILNRKKPWGQKLLYFAVGMLVMYAIPDLVEGIIQGWNEIPL
jgi:hypothetical protein